MLPLTLFSSWRLWAALGLCAACAGGGWTARGWRADAAIADIRAQHAAAVEAAQQEATARAQAALDAAGTLAQQAQEQTDALQTTQARLARAAADLAGARDRVRDAWAASAAGRCPDPSNPSAVAAAESADLVQADVFRIATARAVELAGAVDEQHAYGSACAARYRQVSEALRLLRER